VRPEALSMRLTVIGGSSRRTRRARRCGGSARRSGARPAHGHQMHELGSIDVMRLHRRSASRVTLPAHQAVCR